MPPLKALLWDVDGTLAETERDGHRVAFNQAFRDSGLAWHWDEQRYGELLRVTGGRERLLHDMAQREDAPHLPISPAEREALARQLHARKNARYAELVREGWLSLRPGVPRLMQQCRARGVQMAIVTTTSRANVEVLLHAQLGGGWQADFPVLVCAEDVARKKPDPEAYVRALQALQLDPGETVAVEDSPAGAAAARAARVPVVVTRSRYFSEAVFDGAIAVGAGLDDRASWQPALPVSPAMADGRSGVDLDDIERWHAQAAAALPR
jgi:HAD superfamily hydrolase (TIGR01509 family)